MSERSWTAAEIEPELRRYEDEMRAAGFAESTIRDYVAGARRFLRWLADDGVRVGARLQPPHGFRPPLPGLAHLDWFRDTASPDDLRRVLRDYDVLTGYDRSLEKLRSQVGPAIDMTASTHRSALLGWLRSWGCRHLRRADDERSSAALLEWWSSWRSQVPPPEAVLTGLSVETLDRACAAYAALATAEAAGRSLRTGESTVRFGETAAAKALYVLRPSVFLPWDEPIRRVFGGGSRSGATYRRFLHLVAGTLSGLADRLGVKIEDLPRLLGRPDSTPPKLVDEYLWVTITRGGARELGERAGRGKEEAGAGKVVPAWFGTAYGHYTQTQWDEAVERARDTLAGWARAGKIGFYGELIDALDPLNWPQGPYTGRGRQVGRVLGDVSVGEWLDDRPLLSALVIGKDAGMPGKGFFELYEQLLGTKVGNSDRARLRVWSKEVERCHDFWQHR